MVIKNIIKNTHTMKYDFGQTSHPHMAAVHPNRHFLLIFIWYWRLAVYQKDWCPFWACSIHTGKPNLVIAITNIWIMYIFNGDHLQTAILSMVWFTAVSDSIAICISIGPVPGSCSCKQVSGDLYSTHTPAWFSPVYSQKNTSLLFHSASL